MLLHIQTRGHLGILFGRLGILFGRLGILFGSGLGIDNEPEVELDADGDRERPLNFDVCGSSNAKSSPRG